MRRWPRAVPSSGSSSGATRAATSRGIDVWWHDFVAGQPEQCAALPLDSEAPGLLLYTSGTTGRPKGAVHTHAGALAQTAKEIYLTFDRQPDDRFWWVSDIGWMMGPWEIIGNSAERSCCTKALPDDPTAERFWQMIEHRVTTFGISPTAIRLLMRKAGSGPDGFDLGSLRLLGSTGEPWDESSYRWFFECVGRGRRPILNISGGTEIIGCFLARWRTIAGHGHGRFRRAGPARARPVGLPGVHQTGAFDDARSLALSPAWMRTATGFRQGGPTSRSTWLGAKWVRQRWRRA